MFSKVVLTASLRSLYPLAGIAVIVLYVWLAFLRQDSGLNLWPDFVSGLSTASVYGGSLAAGVSALFAGSWTVTNEIRLHTATRSSVWARFGHFLIVTGYMVAGYLLALAAVASYAAATGTYGRPEPAWLAAIGCALVASSAIGYVFGTLFPARWFTAPLIAVGMYVVMVLIRILEVPYAVESMFPAITNMDNVFVASVPLTMVGQIALWLGLAIALVLLVSMSMGRGRPRSAMVVTSGALVLAVSGTIAVFVTNGLYTTGQNPRDYVCAGDAPVLCMNRGYVAAADDLHFAFARLNMIAADTDLAASRLEQSLEGVDDPEMVNARPIYLEEFNDDQDVALSVQRYVETYGQNMCDNPDYRYLQANLFINAWLSGYEPEFFRSDNSLEVHHLDNLNSMSSEAGREWFNEHADAYLACTLTVDELP